ncbi:MAG: class I SAM-dependent methyltransferase [Cytophagales bacterium]|nr:MAG: class I SAM-dependent methyltransferase [Cytophagales bacterium]
MNPKHLPLLVNPKNEQPLSLKDEVMVNGRVQTGVLYDSTTQDQYPIVNFIPRFVSEDNYAQNFGFQWNLHDKTQYDNEKYNISGKRFAEETRWGTQLNGELMLEVGSGAGRFTPHALATGATLCSLDYSNAVEANYRLNGAHENLLLVQASVYEMPFKKTSFDKVLCIGVIQHTPDPKQSFMELTKMLKSKGKITTDIYKKTFFSYIFNTRYIVRQFTKGTNPEKLYKNVKRYIDFMWPLARIIRKIPKIGPSINWRLMIADYSQQFKNFDDKTLKEWAYLDSMDMLGPQYDFPQTLKTFEQWHKEAGLTNYEVHYGHNGIEGRGEKP